MAFPQTVLPIMSEVLIAGAWTDVTSGPHGIERDNGNGIRISRKPLTWAQQTGFSTATNTFKNSDLFWSYRHPESVNFEKLGLNTRIRHRMRWIYAAFTSSVSSAWPVADTGQSWTNTGGAASDYSSTGGKGIHTLTSVSVGRNSEITLPIGDVDVMVTIDVSDTATGDHIYAGVGAGTSISNMYFARLEFRTNQTLWMTLRKHVSGVETAIVSATQIDDFYTIGTQFTVRLQRLPFGYVRAKCWLGGPDAQPDAWTMSIENKELTSFTKGICRSIRGDVNTDVNPQARFDNFQVSSWRFCGELPIIEPQTDDTGLYKYAPVQAAGITRRLTTGPKPLRSSMFRSMAGVAEGDFVPVAYWPMEDAGQATQVASGLPGGAAGVISGDVNLGSYTGVAGSAPLATLNNGGTISVSVTQHPTTAWQFQFIVSLASLPASDTYFMQWNVIPDITGSIVKFNLYYDQSSDEWVLEGLNSSGGFVMQAQVDATPLGSAYPVTRPYLLAVSHHYTGAGNTETILTLADADFGVVQSDFLGESGGAESRITGIRAVANSVNAGWSTGHWALYYDNAVFTTPSITPNAASMNGHAGETVGARLIRLCQEERVFLDFIGDPADTPQCGIQPLDTFVKVLTTTADVDQGILAETRDTLGYVYRTKKSMLNQIGPALDYNSQQLSIFQPSDNTNDALNYVTASQINGSSATIEITDGRRGTQAPPAGIGKYDEDRSWNIAAPSTLPSFANFRARRGTWDELRYPAIGVAFHRQQIASLPTLMGPLAGLDIGSYFSIINPREDLPPDTIELLEQSYEERLANFEWDITWGTTPAGPYSAGVFGDTTKRYSSNYTTLNEALDSTETGVDIIVVTGRLGWITTASYAARFPFDINIGGERMTVTACSSTGASTYTFTVTRSVNGVVKTHASGSKINLWIPARYA